MVDELVSIDQNMARILVGSFVAVSTIIILNLLIAMLADTFTRYRILLIYIVRGFNASYGYILILHTDIYIYIYITVVELFQTSVYQAGQAENST